ncbi:zinc finger MYM-type protein 1-like [Gordionus sp. m RMFG-2023]|uniref:zinc finger MYM-type protein 1-like n=1 Tax=Gordionus sp. m RMFG-2023 TaxID=3053472 RepID=UPI0031FBB839
MDSTQDICVYDQATICLRYIYNGKITERLFALTKVTNSSGKGFFDILSECFLKHGIQMRNIIRESFDGAANMRGEFVGLQALIRQEAPGSLYIWCYSHILNLCICDSCDNNEGKILFGLLNRLATFFGESYKRMDAWVKQNNSTGQNKLRRLQKIGETRWWAREKALKWTYGKESLLPITISALRFIIDNKSFEAKTSSEAQSLIDNLCKFKTLSTALTESICVQTALPKIRIGRAKRIYSDEGQDKRPQESIDLYRVEVFRPIIDQIINSLSERFSANRELILNVRYLHPRHFDYINSKGISEMALEKLAQLANISSDKLHNELCSFYSVFKDLIAELNETDDDILCTSEESNEEDGILQYDNNSKCDKCNNCLICVYEILKRLIAREHLAMKIIKKRLRANIGQEKLEAFLMMSVERELLSQIEIEDILDQEDNDLSQTQSSFSEANTSSSSIIQNNNFNIKDMFINTPNKSRRKCVYCDKIYSLHTATNMPP